MIYISSIMKRILLIIFASTISILSPARCPDGSEASLQRSAVAPEDPSFSLPGTAGVQEDPSLSLPGAAGVPEERVYVATDKDVYIAGERIWCSVFCQDGNKASEFSSVAYLELLAADHQAAGVKVALKNGRGAATLNIPTETPTGNYRLVAYTALNINEKNHDYLDGSKIISIFNTLSTSRIENGVAVVQDNDSPAGIDSRKEVSDPSLKIDESPDGSMNLTFSGAGSASVSVSVCVQDGLHGEQNPDIRSFCNTSSAETTSGGSSDSKFDEAYSVSRIPEYEGEIIRCRVQGSNNLEGKTIFISFPAESPDAYSADIRKDGSAEFFTQNIYGRRDVVCEIADGPAGSHAIIESPFITPEVGDIPVLNLHKSQESDLLQRSLVLQDNRTAGVDTLISSEFFKHLY